MVAEVLAYLRPERGGVYFDGTLGGGGHTEAMVRAGAERVIAVDQDEEALRVAGLRLEPFGDRVELVSGNFADVAESEDTPLAGALLDLGVSSHQLDEGARGFSFRPGTPLDMRMAQVPGAPTAADLLNDWGEEDLANVFYRYGEERRSRRLAGAVVRYRMEQPFRTSDDLNAVLERFYGPRITVQDRARIYQALRIAVNDELDVLERALVALRDRLESAGVFVVLSYHSLEDRIVKDAFREWSRDCVCPPELPVCRCRGVALGESLTRKPVMAGEEEVAENTRARSARLRAWKKAV
jgi:16S rRNA (cytosine1402-N4)-methyltransferase